MAWFFFDKTKPPAYLSDELFLEVVLREILIGGDGLDILLIDPDNPFAWPRAAIAALMAIKRQACLIPFWFFNKQFYFT